MWRELIFLLVTFLFGCIPFSQILANQAGLGDLRELGSKNPGVANLYRIGGKRYALPAAILDSAKGALPIYLAGWLVFSPWIGVLGGVLGMLGHNYSPFLQFRGGKGLSAGTGMLIALDPTVAFACLLLAGIVNRFFLHWVPGSAVVMVLSFILCAIVSGQNAPVIAAPFAMGTVSFLSWFPKVMFDPVKRVPPAMRDDGSTY